MLRKRATYYLPDSSLSVLVVLLLVFWNSSGQQDPQYTYYMYNTLSVNPAYKWENTVIDDALWLSQEKLTDANVSYTTPVNQKTTQCSSSLKAGWHNISTDWSELRFKKMHPLFHINTNLSALIVDGSLYLSDRDWYLGLTIPKFSTTRYYDGFQESSTTEILHYFIHDGYVFNQSRVPKFKPLFLLKAVSGVSMIAHISANFLFNDAVTLGATWHWDDNIATLAGVHVKKGLNVGYDYNPTTTDLNNYTSGTHEIILSFEFQELKRILLPRYS